MKDLIESGRNGLLMPIRSPEAIVRAVSELIDNPDLRRRLGTAARLDARTHYTWDLSADRVASIYERLLGGQWVKAAKAS
jgi:glycosyltransferase involved in cell wall biosynthesis